MSFVRDLYCFDCTNYYDKYGNQKPCGDCEESLLEFRVKALSLLDDDTIPASINNVKGKNCGGDVSVLVSPAMTRKYFLGGFL